MFGWGFIYLIFKFCCLSEICSMLHFKQHNKLFSGIIYNELSLAMSHLLHQRPNIASAKDLSSS